MKKDKHFLFLSSKLTPFKILIRNPPADVPRVTQS